jgi:hypothetical protein
VRQAGHVIPRINPCPPLHPFWVVEEQTRSLNTFYNGNHCPYGCCDHIYSCTKKTGKRLRAYNLVMNFIPNNGMTIDHINKNSLNNRLTYELPQRQCNQLTTICREIQQLDEQMYHFIQKARAHMLLTGTRMGKR